LHLNRGTSRQQCRYIVPKAELHLNRGTSRQQCRCIVPKAELHLNHGTSHQQCQCIVPKAELHLNHGTSRQQCQCIVPTAVYTVKKCSRGWANLSPETCRADLKRLINEKVVASCWLLTSLY
jgi:hypothetical protein